MLNTIIHGDCLETMAGMSDESIDLILTDPPYGIEYKSNRQGIDRKLSNAREGDIVVRQKYFQKINNDDSVPTEWLAQAYRVAKSGGAIYVFCRWDKWDILKPAVQKAGFIVKNMIVINKSNHGMGDLMGQYAPKHELLLFASKGRHLLSFPSGRKSDVWDLPVKFSGARRLHPNEKPVSWFDRAIENSLPIGGVMLDPFCGSGASLESAKRHGRTFIGIDNDAEYVRIARERLGLEIANG